jgi:sterol desaturase/sphingolipid hydroxylase (fatty acid hydroxylase superfamily)
VAACATGLLAMALYELCHAMQHLGYQPHSRFLRRIKQRHLAHHFHDEGSNFGITSGLVDRLCGTLDRPRRRGRSPHVFDLGYDAEERRRYPWVATLSEDRADRP